MPSAPPLGFVKTIPTPDLTPGARQLLSVIVRVRANSQESIQLSGDMVFTESCTFDWDGSQATLSVITDRNPALAVSRPGREIHLPTQFSRIQFVNATAFAITFVGFVGFGQVDDMSNGSDGAVLSVGSFSSGLVMTAGFTRPGNVTPYAAGQVMSANPGVDLGFTGGARVSGGAFIITRARCIKNSVTVANANFRAFIRNSNGGPPNDQAAFPLTYSEWEMGMATGNRTYYSFLDFPAFVTGGAGSDMSVCDVAGLNIPIKLDSGKQVFSLAMMSLAAYVPTNGEKFQFELFLDRY